VEGIVRVIRALICGAIVVAATGNGAAQTRAARAVQPSPQLFNRLFRACQGCEDRPGAMHLVMDSPRLTDAWLSRHARESNGGPDGDNAAIADFWYDAVHRRLFTRSLVLHEVDDPADLRLGRAPGTPPESPDFRARLNEGTTVGHVGFVRWGDNGFGAYFAAVQGAVRDGGTGYLDLSTVTGAFGTTRTGSRYDPEDLIKHVRLHPSGQLEIGFETDPQARPDESLLVRGNVRIDGSLIVDAERVGDPAPPLACGVLTTTGRGRSASVSCFAGHVATGGGGTCAAGEMRGSRPILVDDVPSGWELSCSREGAHVAYVICCVR